MADEELMTHWDYRVTKQVLDGETQYAIREVYYNGTRIVSWTADIIGASGETVEEVRDELERMMVATLAPVIDITDENNPKEE
jgi:hypothetical protein